jgi:hypothetical protein
MPMPTAATQRLAESSTCSVYARHFGCNRDRYLSLKKYNH